MSKKCVYILLRMYGHASPTIDGVFTTEKKAEKYRDELLEEFGESYEIANGTKYKEV